MQILDVYTKKEYECKKCKGKIYYAKVANNMGELYTTDGNAPNGKFGKDSNILTCQVDALVKDRVHGCSKAELEGKLPSLENKENTKQVVINPPMVKEMSVADIAEPALRRETLVNLKVLKVIEDEVIKFLGKDTNPAKVGMFMKLVMDMGKKN